MPKESEPNASMTVADDIHADVEEAYEAVEAAEAEPVAEKQQTLPFDKKTKPAKPPKVPAKKEISKPITEQAANTVEPTDSAPAEESDKPILPPHSWNKDARADWNNLPRNLQAYLVEMDKNVQADHTRKTQEIAKAAKRFEELERVIAPYQQDLAVRGVTLGQFMQQAFASDRLLRSGPAGIHKFLTEYVGIDPRALLQVASGANGPAVQAPQNANLDGYLNPLTQRISQLEQLIQRQQTNQRNQTVKSVADLVERFRNETDEDGNPKYPYVNDVYEEMAHHIALARQRNPQANPLDLLQSAYDYCTYGNMAVREKLEQDRKLREEALQKANVARARKAGVSLPAQGNGSNTEQLPDDLHKLVAHLYDALE